MSQYIHNCITTIGALMVLLWWLEKRLIWKMSFLNNYS